MKPMLEKKQEQIKKQTEMQLITDGLNILKELMFENSTLEQY